jgi:hypothetical protein
MLSRWASAIPGFPTGPHNSHSTESRQSPIVEPAQISRRILGQ